MINAFPPVLAPHNSFQCQTLNMATVVFGSFHPGAVETDFIERHSDKDVFLDELDGIWRGVSNMTVDGRGRQVGLHNHTDPTDEEIWLIW